MAFTQKTFLPLLCLLLAALYPLSITADPIAGLFGILWSDEGVYLLSSKNQALFGEPIAFPGDVIDMRYPSPLLYHFGVWLMSPTDTIEAVRLGMVVVVLLAQCLVARLAALYHGSASAGWVCLTLLLITPMLFFYARTGLSEGLQFFILAVHLWVFYGLWHATSTRAAYGYAMLSAALVALMFLSKVSAIAMSVALALTTLVAIGHSKAITRKWLAVLCSAAVGLAAFIFLFWIWFDGNFTTWLARNINNTAYNDNVPGSLFMVLDHLTRHYQAIHYFITLMPIFVLGYAGLYAAGDRTKGFLWLLWLLTALTVAASSLFPGEIRRSFYELSLMMILAGFSLSEFLREGIPKWRRSRSSIASLVIIGAYLLGGADFMQRAIGARDTVYTFTAITWLILCAATLLPRGERYRVVRTSAMGVMAVCSLAPMLYQGIFAPHTIAQAARAIEARVDDDSTITGFVTPWMFIGVKKRTLMTNCSILRFDFANEPNTLPTDRHYYFLAVDDGAIRIPSCVMPGFHTYDPVLPVRIFYPFNKGLGYGGSRGWIWEVPLRLYEQPRNK